MAEIHARSWPDDETTYEEIMMAAKMWDSLDCTLRNYITREASVCEWSESDRRQPIWWRWRELVGAAHAEGKLAVDRLIKERIRKVGRAY